MNNIMDEENFNIIINEYYNFRSNFSDNINNSSINLNKETYYLIEENWIDNLKEGFNKYKDLKKKNELNEEFDYYDLLPEVEPNFINDCCSILKYIENGKKIKCLSKKLFELIYGKNKLKGENYIKYYSGNNKLIIEYENDNKAILLIDPLNQREIKNNIKIILIKDKQKNKLFKNLLSNKHNISDKFLNYIMPIDIYLNTLKNILKLFIYFYYYEKDLKENQESFFNKNGKDRYYLIAPEWLNEFKDIFNYSEINDSLKLIDRKIKNINYNNLNNYYDEIISQIDENFLNKKKVLFGEIFDAENLKLYSQKIYNIIYHKNCYIINSQIMNIIKSIFKDNQINIKSRNIFFMDNRIYIFYDKKVIIEKLNQILLFIPKYILVYNSKEILESEKKYLLKDTIENYINEFECDLNNPNLQILEDNGEKIGKLVVLNQVQSNNRTSNKQKNKSLPKITNSFNNSKSFIIANKIVNIRTEKDNMNHSTDHYDYENNYYLYEKKNSNKNTFENVNNIAFKDNKKGVSNKIKKNIKINKNEDIAKKNSNEEQINNYYKDNEDNNKKMGKLIKNNFQENCSEKDEKNIYFKNGIYNNFMNKFNTLNQQKLELEKEPEENQNENELIKYIFFWKILNLINSNKKQQKHINDLNKSINDYEEILRKKENIINEYRNKYLKIEDELKKKDNKLKGYLNIQKELENKEKEIININKKFEDYQNYINELENKNKENEIIKLKGLNNNEENQKIEELLNKSNEENKRIKQINLKRKKKISDLEKELDEQYKINNELKNKNNELKNKIKELEKKIDDEHKNNFEEAKINEQINDKKRRELDERESIIKMRENEIKKKLASLEEKEDLIEKEKKEIEIKKKQLEKEIEENKRLIQINKKEKNSRNPFEKYLTPPLIGLNNIGATCFMNSTLQCLSQTIELTKYFLEEENENKIINNNIALTNKNSLQLSPIYLELIKKLWDEKGEKSFSPNNFMNIVEKMNPLFKKGQAGDSKDFIIFILEQLHKELKKSFNNNGSDNNIPLNQFDKNNAFNYFFNDFKKECSIISDVFFGFTETTNECLYCKNYYNSQGSNNPICYNYGIFNCLIFPLEEVKNMKNNSIQNNNNNIQNNNNHVSIYECFNYNQKTDFFTGENKNYCPICKQLWDSNYTSKIFISPNILILILNRGKGNIYDVKLDFTETIDITQFVLQKDKSQLIYNLYGVITHIGESGPNAHFVASCKNSIDHKWYRFNDAFVNPINNFQKEVIEFGTPYILFYQKV